MLPAVEWNDRDLKQAARGVAARGRKHGVAFPGVTATMGGPPRKKARAQQKKKRPAAAPPGIGPQPKKKKGPRPYYRSLAAAAPTQEGSRGPVTEE